MAWSIRRSNPFDPPTLTMTRPVRWAVMAMVAAGLLAAGWGTVSTWPDDSRRPAGLVGESGDVVSAEVVEVALRCPSTAELKAGTTPAKTCGTLTAEVEGKTVTVEVPASVTYAEVGPGDTVRLATESGKRGAYTYLGSSPTTPLLVLGAGLAVLAVVTLGERGARALVAGGAMLALTWWWLLPAVVQGRDPWLVSAVAAAWGVAAWVGVTHGTSVRTGAAVVAGWCAAAGGLGLAYAVARSAALTGLGSADGEATRQLAPALVSEGLWVAAVALGVAGLVAHQAITQVNAVWEVRAATPRATRREVAKTALRATRDQVASLIGTVLAVGLAGGFAALALSAAYGVGAAELLTVEGTRQWWAMVGVLSVSTLGAGPLAALVGVWIAPGSRLAPEGFAHRTYGPTS